MSEQPKASVEQTFYDVIGGHETIAFIVRRFYEGVATDDVLLAIYPDEDLEPAERRFRMFLEQYWGGPTTYSEERGHPRLRMRHGPFAVTHLARERWLHHFRVALDEAELAPEHEAQFWAYVERAALHMVNSPD